MDPPAANSRRRLRSPGVRLWLVTGCIVLIAFFAGSKILAWGSLAWALGIVGALAGLLYFSMGAARREHALLLARLGPRDRVPVPEQVRGLLLSRGIAVSEPSVRLLSARWADVARVLRIDPALLRTTDELSRDYGANDPSGEPLVADFLATAVDRRAADFDLAPPPRARRAHPGECGFCGYNLTGLPDGAPCPECGAHRIAIRTLGDYLLFVSRLPEAERSTEEDRPV